MTEPSMTSSLLLPIQKLATSLSDDASYALRRLVSLSDFPKPPPRSS